MKNIGFIGTGVMGESMARNLSKHGFNVFIYNRTKSKAEALIAEGLTWCDSVAECAAGRDAVITIVGYPKDVEEVYFGEDGIIANAKSGTYIIDMTTTSPQLSQRIYKEAHAHGLYALDAPVSGGDGGARDGTLAIMVGGDKPAFEACTPLFEAMGKNIFYEGTAGNGQHVKMANQIVIAGTVTGVCEAVAYARAAGVDLDTMLKTIGCGAAASAQLQKVAPKMISGDFAPGFYIKHFIKDMSIAQQEAQTVGLSLEILQQACRMFQKLEAQGKGDNGTQGIIEYYNK
ncbi:MAG: NAD(P)-dependent oxidoreductase [Candidatus Fimivivens sp.]|nr:NAD(P)-dependent oxidoreductase [Candidatus Fimivivens sp.]